MRRIDEQHLTSGDAIRRQFHLAADPAAAGWTERFLHFAGTGRLNKSYKPVMLLALLDTVNRDGEVPLAVLAEAGLTYRDVLALRAALAEQIARYYAALSS